MNAKKRNEMMTQFRAIARKADQSGDVVARRQAAQDWRELSTDHEANRAPKYLTWYGRK